MLDFVLDGFHQVSLWLFTFSNGLLALTLGVVSVVYRWTPGIIHKSGVTETSQDPP